MSDQNGGMIMPLVNTKKVTISIPMELLLFTDFKASELGICRSQVIGDLIKHWRDRELDELAKEGYQFFAQEAEEFAESSATAVAEALNT